jgi:uncharacterized membrane protein
MERRGLKAASRQCIRDAGGTKKVTLVWLLAMAAIVAAQWGFGLAMEHLPASSGHYLSESFSAGSRAMILEVVVGIALQMVVVLLMVGYAAFALRLSRGERSDCRVLLAGGAIWGKTILLYLMTSVLLSLWASAFSIPVSYILAMLYMGEAIGYETYVALLMGYMAVVMFVVSYRYRMAWFVLMDQPELSARQALNQAKALNKAHRWQLFRLDLSFLPWLLLCAATCGILLIWKLPYITATYAHAYNFMLEDYAQRQRRMEEILEEQKRRLNGQM